MEGGTNVVLHIRDRRGETEGQNVSVVAGQGKKTLRTQ